MQTKSQYIVTLVAGGRVGGAKINSAEFKHMQQHMLELTNLYASAVIKTIPVLGMMVLELTEAEAVALANDTRAYSVTKSVLHKTHMIQQDAGWALSFLCGSTNNVYEYGSTGKGVTVYVLDTGFNVTDFPGSRSVRLIDAQYDMHGTQVAQLVSSTTYGAAKEANLVNVQVSGNTSFPTADVLDAITATLLDMQTTPGPWVVNMSLGGPADQTLDDAVKALVTDGAVVVVSAGNDGIDASLQSPSRLSEVITVAAVNTDGSLASFSNYGTCVDTQAPGVDVSTSLGLFSGTSAAAPLVAGVVAKVLELAPNMTCADVQTVLPSVCNKMLPALVTELPLVPGRVRTWWYNGTVKEYGDWTYLSLVASLGVIRTTSKPFIDTVSVRPSDATLVPGTNPSLPPLGPNVIPLTLDPDTVYSYSVSLSYASGTFSYAGLLPVVPAIGDVISVQGLNGVIKRVGPSLSRSAPGQQVEGRIMPLFVNELISLHKPDGCYTVSSLVTEAASKAGTVVQFNGTETVLKSFDFAGRFTEVLGQLATEACATLLQQNGSWFILPVDQAVGSFAVSDCINCRQYTIGDAFDYLMPLITEYYAACADFNRLQRLLDKLKATDTSASMEKSHTAVQAFTHIAFEFGNKNGATRMLEASVQVEGGEWDTWTGSVGNLQYYYQVLPEPSRGCKTLSRAKLLVAVQEPSNSSGLFFAKGKLTNLSTPFWTGDEETWGYIAPTYRDVIVDGKDARQLYFEFEIDPLTWNQPVPIQGVPSCDVVVDQRQYLCQLDLGYMPLTVSSSSFVGTIQKANQPVFNANTVVASLPRKGGTVTSVNGNMLWNYNAETGIFSSQSGVKQAELVNSCIKGVNGVIYGTLGNQDMYPVHANANRIIGIVTEAGEVLDTTNTHVGSWQAPLWQSDVGVVKAGQSTIGNVYGGDTDTPKIVLNVAVKSAYGDNLFDSVARDTLANDIAATTVDRDVAAAKIACIEKALIRYHCNIGAIRTVAARWDDYYAEKEKTSPDAVRLKELETVAQNAADQFLTTLNQLPVNQRVTEITCLYTGDLPLPGNRLTVNIQGISSTDAGIVESVDLSFSSTNCSMSMVARSWI